jgi:hypothetical protein
VTFEVAMQLISLLLAFWGVYLARLGLKKSSHRSVSGSKAGRLVGALVIARRALEKAVGFSELSTWRGVMRSKKVHEVHATFTSSVDIVLSNPPFQKKSFVNSSANKKRTDSPWRIENGSQKKLFDIGVPMEKAFA